jgi:hypothetical protein
MIFAASQGRFLRIIDGEPERERGSTAVRLVEPGLIETNASEVLV